MDNHFCHSLTCLLEPGLKAGNCFPKAADLQWEGSPIATAIRPWLGRWGHGSLGSHYINQPTLTMFSVIFFEQHNFILW